MSRELDLRCSSWHVNAPTRGAGVAGGCFACCATRLPSVVLSLADLREGAEVRGPLHSAVEEVMSSGNIFMSFEGCFS